MAINDAVRSRNKSPIANKKSLVITTKTTTHEIAAQIISPQNGIRKNNFFMLNVNKPEIITLKTQSVQPIFGYTENRTKVPNKSKAPILHSKNVLEYLYYFFVRRSIKKTAKEKACGLLSNASKYFI